MRCVVLLPAFLAQARRRQVQQMGVGLSHIAADFRGACCWKGVIKLEGN